MKQIKLTALALLLVVLVAMPVFAAGQVVTSGATVAYEILGAARNISLSGSPALGLTLGNTLQTGTVLTLNLSNGALFTPSQTYYLCANNSAVSSSDVIQIGAGAASATNSVLPLAVNVSSGANVSLGQTIWLTSNIACNYPGSFNFVVGPGASVGASTLSGNVILPGTTILMDRFAANNVAVISRQYTTHVLNTASIVSIDYINGAADGTTLESIAPSTNVTGGSHSLNVTSTSLTYNVTSVSGSFNQVLTLTDSLGDWSGLSRVFVSNSESCVGASPGAVNVPVPASGSITLHYPNAANILAGSNTTLCVNVAGNVSLPSRTISGSYAYEAVASTSSSALSLNPPASGASFVWQVWSPNGYQAFNPYMYVGTSQDATYDMFCRFYNTSSQTAQVFVDVYAVAGSAPVRYTLAPIASNSSGTYWGSNIGLLASIPPGQSYAALFTITAPPPQINGVSFFKRASSGDRQLPLYKTVRADDTYKSE